MNNQEAILDTIIKQSVKGYTSWQLEPMWLTVEENTVTIDRPGILTEIENIGAFNFNQVSRTITLDNDILILVSNQVDIPLHSTLTFESLDNIFSIGRAEFNLLTYHRNQVFKRYLKIELSEFGTFDPFQLEFIRITPTV